MGFKRSRVQKVYKLKFADPEFEGLEVRARSVALGQFMELSSLADLKNRSLTPEDQERIDNVFQIFCGALVSWNLEEDDGTPVPPTVEGLYSQDFDFVLEVILAWMDAIAGVSVPLEQRSSDGEQFQGASIPMDAL